MPFKYASLIDRIIANSILADDSFFNGTPCWNWIGRQTINRSGMKYGRISRRITKGPRKGKVVNEFVHRVVVRGIKGRRLTRRSVAMHLCNNSLCVNPDHLGGGKQSTNVRQAVREGRHGNATRSPVSHPQHSTERQAA
jgi:hypothetical protein